MVTRSVATRDNIQLQELDHTHPKQPHVVHDDPEIVMIIQRDVSKSKKSSKPKSRVKQHAHWGGAAHSVCISASTVHPTGLLQAAHTAPFLGQYPATPASQSPPWWALGPPLPHGKISGICGKKVPSIRCRPHLLLVLRDPMSIQFGQSGLALPTPTASTQAAMFTPLAAQQKTKSTTPPVASDSSDAEVDSL